MERFGFTGYWREWWHFEHRVALPRSKSRLLVAIMGVCPLDRIC